MVSAFKEVPIAYQLSEKCLN